jgi:phospholipid transport system substrate-binding protein
MIRCGGNVNKKEARIFIYVITCLTLIFLSTASASGAAKAAIESTVNAVIDVMRDKALSGTARAEERRTRISALIRERFDFVEMSKRSLARHWKKRSAEEKSEFVSLFSKLLEGSYIRKIEKYTDEEITYDKEVIKRQGKYGIVATTVITKKADIPIDYKVRLKGSEWLVYDVIIEGVSFISTYRSQYNSTIKKESYEGLINKMKLKLDELNASL